MFYTMSGRPNTSLSRGRTIMTRALFIELSMFTMTLVGMIFYFLSVNYDNKLRI